VLTATDQKTAKIIKKVILLSITLTYILQIIYFIRRKRMAAVVLQLSCLLTIV